MYLLVEKYKVAKKKLYIKTLHWAIENLLYGFFE